MKSVQKSNNLKKSYLSDYTLIYMISSIIREDIISEHLFINKGVWLWNRTDSTFICSPGFRRIMNISTKVVPDLDFWVEKLATNDLISFSDILESVLSDFNPRNFMFQFGKPDYSRKIIKCMLEGMEMQSENKIYVICVLNEYDLSEN